MWRPPKPFPTDMGKGKAYLRANFNNAYSQKTYKCAKHGAGAEKSSEKCVT